MEIIKIHLKDEIRLHHFLTRKIDEKNFEYFKSEKYIFFGSKINVMNQRDSNDDENF